MDDEFDLYHCVRSLRCVRAAHGEKVVLMLRVYVAHDCPMSALSLQLIERLRQQYPDLPLEVIDVGNPDVTLPVGIFGTPTYTWDDDVLFLGNPSETALLERVRGMDEHKK
jgi:hypothetical protein